MTDVERFELIKREVARLNNELDPLRRNAFELKCKELFEEYPDLDAFRWTQYTPYFNDGMPCQFESNHDDCFIKMINSEEFLETYRGRPNELRKAISDSLAWFSNEDFDIMFGDGYQITISREGIEVEYYNHD